MSKYHHHHHHNHHREQNHSIDALNFFLEQLKSCARQNDVPEIIKVVSNEKNGYTIVKFSNGDVSKVFCSEDNFDVEKGVLLAICKYFIGFKGIYKALDDVTVIKKEQEEEDKNEQDTLEESSEH